MLSTDIDLGSLSLVTKLSELRLQLDSRATFLASAEDGVDTLQEAPTSERLSVHNSDKTWITQSCAFRFAVSLTINYTIAIDEQEQLIESLSARLRMAKIWQQLGLTATSTQITSSAAQSHLIIVSLTPVNFTRSLKNTLHRLGNHCDDHSIQPPAGVRCALLDCVELDIKIAQCVQRKRRRRVERTGGTDSRDDASDGLHQDLPIQTLHASSSAANITAAGGSSDKADQSDRALLFTSSEASCGGNYGDGDASDMLLDGTCESELNETQKIDAVPSLLKRSSSATDLDINGFTPDLDAMLGLIDAAVMASLAGVSSIKSKSVSLEEVSSFRAVSELAPAVFSPCHLRATAERAVFLPTIAHALSGVRFRSKNKPDHTAMPDLAINSMKKRQGHGQVDAARLSASLWHTLQSGIYDATAVKRLRPLAESNSKTACSAIPRNEILEVENDSAYCSDVLRNDYDDIDLFEQDLEDPEDLKDVNDMLSDGGDSEYDHSESLLLDDEASEEGVDDELLFTPRSYGLSLANAEDELYDIGLWEDLLEA